MYLSCLAWASTLLAVILGLSSCTSGKTGDETKWPTIEKAFPPQTQSKGQKASNGPGYTYDGKLAGTVKDGEGYPLEKVSVVAKIPGDPHVFATATDRYGKYELIFPKKLVKEIEFSMLGKESVSVQPGKKKKIDIVLQDAAIELDPGLLERPGGAFGIIPSQE